MNKEQNLQNQARREYHAQVEQRRKQIYTQTLTEPSTHSDEAQRAEALRKFQLEWGSYLGVRRLLGSLKLFFLFQSQSVEGVCAQWELDDATIMEAAPEEFSSAGPKLLLKIGLEPSSVQGDTGIRNWTLPTWYTNKELLSLAQLIPTSTIPKAFSRVLEDTHKSAQTLASTEEGRATGGSIRLPAGRAYASSIPRDVGYDNATSWNTGVFNWLRRIWYFILSFLSRRH